MLTGSGAATAPSVYSTNSSSAYTSEYISTSASYSNQRMTTAWNSDYYWGGWVTLNTSYSQQLTKMLSAASRKTLYAAIIGPNQGQYNDRELINASNGYGKAQGCTITLSAASKIGSTLSGWLDRSDASYTPGQAYSSKLIGDDSTYTVNLNFYMSIYLHTTSKLSDTYGNLSMYSTGYKASLKMTANTKNTYTYETYAVRMTNPLTGYSRVFVSNVSKTYSTKYG